MFYVAGGFGSYLNMQNAEVIGLIPKGLAKKSTVIGNAALAGASMLLLDETLWAHSEEIAKNAEVLSLATDTFFMDQYVEQMMF